jgi:hypothetical protein
MEDAIKRIVDKNYPELTGQLHLPRFAQVVNVRETPTNGAIADEYRPHYAVSIQVLDEHGQPDSKFPVLHDVPLSLPTAGHESGQFSYPENGAHVEVGFAYGSPNKPFIRNVIPHGRSLPDVKRGEMKRQHSTGRYDGFDKDGNHAVQTDGTLTNDSLKRIISSLENLETYTQSLRNVEADETDTIGGTKTIKAMGAMRINSGGRTEILSIQDLVSTSNGKQLLKAPKTWVGSNSENVLGLLSELMAQVILLANVLASHTHPSVGVISQASSVTAVSTSVTGIKGRLDGIKE